MSTTRAGDPAFRLPRELVARLFTQRAGEEVDGASTLHFFCRALEGSECFVLSEEQAAAYAFRYDADIERADNRIERDLASELLRSLDVRRVERARNNTLLVRCRLDTAGLLGCEANPGDGDWHPVTLE